MTEKKSLSDLALKQKLTFMFDQRFIGQIDGNEQ